MTAAGRTMATPALPVRTGAFIAVVGPSGAGKDTLIDYARKALSDEAGVEFVRRVITRPCDGETEDHDSLTAEAFEDALEAGAFALAWGAHGLRYALPASAGFAVAQGRVAVANVSRAVIAALRDRYAKVVVVEITAPPDVLAARLAARGRETGGAVEARLGRTNYRDNSLNPDLRIDNSGDRSAAGERLVAAIREALAHAQRPDRH